MCAVETVIDGPSQPAQLSTIIISNSRVRSGKQTASKPARHSGSGERKIVADKRRTHAKKRPNSLCTHRQAGRRRSLGLMSSTSQFLSPSTAICPRTPSTYERPPHRPCARRRAANKAQSRELGYHAPLCTPRTPPQKTPGRVCAGVLL